MHLRNFINSHLSSIFFSTCLHGAIFGLSMNGPSSSLRITLPLSSHALSVELKDAIPLKTSFIHKGTTQPLVANPPLIGEPFKEKRRLPKQQSNVVKSAKKYPTPPNLPPASQESVPAKIVTPLLTPKEASYTLGSAQNPAPNYPLEAREMGYEGLVIIRLRVDEEGRVRHLELIQSSGYDTLDQSALRSLAQWRLKPACDGKKSIPTNVNVPIQFILDTSN